MYHPSNRPGAWDRLNDSAIEEENKWREQDDFAPDPEREARMAAYEKQRRLFLGLFIVWVICLAFAFGWALTVFLNCLLNSVC